MTSDIKSRIFHKSDMIVWVTSRVCSGEPKCVRTGSIGKTIIYLEFADVDPSTHMPEKPCSAHEIQHSGIEIEQGNYISARLPDTFRICVEFWLTFRVQLAGNLLLVLFRMRVLYSLPEVAASRRRLNT